MDETTGSAELIVDRIYRAEYPRILATVARLTGDLDLAEDAVQDSISAALVTWDRTGAPDNPGAWLTTAARNRAVDLMRRDGRRDRAEAEQLLSSVPPTATPPGSVDDDQLRLMFVTCHPALTPETRIALTLRYVCGLRTAEIARVLLVGDHAVTKRIRRARKKIRDARIPMDPPSRERLGERLRSVLDCLYLVFTEGYSASGGDDLVRADLCEESIRLTRLALATDPRNAAALSLLALELLQHSRSAARVDAAGRLVVLADQDRSSWDRDRIDEGLALLDRARSIGDTSAVARSYLLQASIAAEHSRSPSWAATDWPRICSLYDELADLTGSPVVGLNRVVAVSMVHGPAVALVQLDELRADGRLSGSHQWHLVRADLLERNGDVDAAAAELRAALDAPLNAPERALIAGRLQRVDAGGVELS